jgi:hypothetical protein
MLPLVYVGDEREYYYRVYVYVCVCRSLARDSRLQPPLPRPAEVQQRFELRDEEQIRRLRGQVL